jgi:hypothetical protein
MKPLEVRGYVLDILLGSFTHAAVHYVPQDYKHIQGGLDASKALDTVIAAPGTYRTK